MRKVAVIGVGQTKFSGAQKKSNIELFAEAAMDAINEANLKPGNIQALFVGNSLSGFEEGQQMVQSFIADAIGAFNIPANLYDGACASGTVAIRDAFMWVASGHYDIVLAGGTERVASMGTGLATRTFAMYSDSRYESVTGITFPGIFALLTHLYSRKYNIPLEKLKEQMAYISVKAHKYGLHNPKAHLHKNITMERVLNSPMISQPLQLHDCCPFSDGAAAVVLASEDAARKLTKKPVYIIGLGQASAGPLLSQQEHLPRIIAREISARQAYKMAGLTPNDIDVCELHDSFTIAEIIAMEGLGFFNSGTGGEATMKGETMLGGKIAINPSGGLKSKGHPIGATGAAQVYEIVRQLRGEHGETQVDGARIGMTDTLGGDGSTAGNLILQRGW